MGFVRSELVSTLPPPVTSRGGWATLHSRLFSTPFNIIATFVCVALVLLLLPPLIRFLFIDATWTGTSREDCLPRTGACWPFIAAKFGQFIYGFYPIAERWRPNLVFGLGAVLLAPLLIPSAPFKRLNALLFFGVFPVVAFVLLTGGNLDLRAFLIGRLVRLDRIVGLASVANVRLSFWIDFFLSTVIASGLAAVFASIAGARARSALLFILSVFAVLGIVLLAVDLEFGLAPVHPSLWGGLLITLVVALTGIVVSLPLGILLALGRRSDLPIVHWFSVVFIEFWRGVPLITVLFFAAYMLPLFLPTGANVEGLVRILIGVSLFAAAYMAEVIRGGLQAIPKGQYEAAAALGLGYWPTMGLIVVPQAVRLVIPGIVNNFIGLFKDTTLVLIVAIFDLLGVLRAAFADPTWSTPSTLFTGFAFAGFVYFVFCFGMSRYSLFVERRVAAGFRR